MTNNILSLRLLEQPLEAEETRLLQALSIQESAQHLLDLYAAFEPHLQATAHLFADERRAALAELQSRLDRLAQWQATHAEPLPINPDPSENPE